MQPTLNLQVLELVSEWVLSIYFGPDPKLDICKYIISVNLQTASGLHIISPYFTDEETGPKSLSDYLSVLGEGNSTLKGEFGNAGIGCWEESRVEKILKNDIWKARQEL